MTTKTSLLVAVPSIILLAVACSSDPATGEDAGSSSSSSSSGDSGNTSSSSGDSGNDSGTPVVDAGVDAPLGSFTVGGNVTGLTGAGLVLQINGGGDLAVNAAGAFTFAGKITTGVAWTVTVKTQPSVPTQTCTVNAGTGTGTMGVANVTTVGITCATNLYKVGGKVTGLDGTLVLQNNLADDRTLTADGNFDFATSIESGKPYAVTVKTQPAFQICTVTMGSGNVTNAAITTVDVKCATPTSCKAIKMDNPNAADGNYMIDPDGAGAMPAVSTFCDMTTDGGGYSYIAVDGGIATTRFDQANTCTAMGLNLAIPRTQAHLAAMVAKYGATYIRVVPGVYGLAAGNYTNCTMNSTDGVCAANWKAIDGGAWYAKNVNYSEPNGDYTPGCWLGTDGQGFDANGFIRFNDANCNYSTGTSYICSDNAK